MSSQDAYTRIHELRRAIERHNELYYQQAAPEIADREYDALVKELADLESAQPEWFAPDSPTRVIGEKPEERASGGSNAVPTRQREMTFTAIDFETANFSRASVCSVGVVTIICGRVQKRIHQLIRPTPMKFEPFNVSIHGITAHDVSSAPTFEEFWPTLLDSFIGPIIAHNASFDLSVLRKSLDHSNLSYPEIDYFCTRVISQLVWPDQPTFALGHIAATLGIDFIHHNAEEDAYACANIALAACQVSDASSPYGLKDTHSLLVGRIFERGYRPCSGCYSINKRFRQREKVQAADIRPSHTTFDDSSPVYERAFVFTGGMNAMSRTDAMQAVVDRGGLCHDRVRKNTDYVVIGQFGFRGYEAGHKSQKIKQAEVMRSKGYPIEILPESDFIQMLEELP